MTTKCRMQCNEECGMSYINFIDNKCQIAFSEDDSKQYMPSIRQLSNEECHPWYMTSNSELIQARVEKCRQIESACGLNYVITALTFSNGKTLTAAIATDVCQSIDAESSVYAQYTCDSQNGEGIFVEYFENELCITNTSDTNTRRRTLIAPKNGITFECSKSNNDVDENLETMSLNCRGDEGYNVQLVKTHPLFENVQNQRDTICLETEDEIYHSDYFVDYIKNDNCEKMLVPYAMDRCHAKIDDAEYTKFSCNSKGAGVKVFQFDSLSDCESPNSTDLTNGKYAHRWEFPAQDLSKILTTDRYYYACNLQQIDDIIEFDVECDHISDPENNVYIVDNVPGFSQAVAKLTEFCPTDENTNHNSNYNDFFMDNIKLMNGETVLLPFTMNQCHATSDAQVFKKYTCDADSSGVWIETFTNGINDCTYTNSSNVKRNLFHAQDIAPIGEHGYYQCNGIDKKAWNHPFSIRCNMDTNVDDIYISFNAPGWKSIFKKLETSCSNINVPDGPQAPTANFFVADATIDQSEPVLVPYAMNKCQAIKNGMDSKPDFQKFLCDWETNGIWIEAYDDLQSCENNNDTANSNKLKSRTQILYDDKGMEGKQGYWECNIQSANDNIFTFDPNCHQDHSNHMIYVARSIAGFDDVETKLTRACSSSDPSKDSHRRPANYYVDEATVGSSDPFLVPFAMNKCQTLKKGAHGTANDNDSGYFRKYTCDFDTGGAWITTYHNLQSCENANITENSQNFKSRTHVLKENKSVKGEAGYFECNSHASTESIIEFDSDCHDQESDDQSKDPSRHIIYVAQNISDFNDIKTKLIKKKGCDSDESDIPETADAIPDNLGVNYFIDYLYPLYDKSQYDQLENLDIQMMAPFAVDMCQPGPYDGVFAKYTCDENGDGMWRHLYIDHYCQIPLYYNDTNDQFGTNGIVSKMFADNLNNIPPQKQLFDAPSSDGISRYDFRCDRNNAYKALPGQVVEVVGGCAVDQSGNPSTNKDEDVARFYVVSDVCVSTQFKADWGCYTIRSNENCGAELVAWSKTRPCNQDSDVKRSFIGSTCSNNLQFGNIRSDSCINPSKIITANNDHAATIDDAGEVSFWTTFWNSAMTLLTMIYHALTQGKS